MNRACLVVPVLLLACSFAFAADPPTAPKRKGPPKISDFQPLFDGKTFKGWEGDTDKTWRIEDGAIVAGSLEQTSPRNEFLATEKEYENFELRLKYKLIGTVGFVNGGVQFRSQRVPNHHEVSGYQADLGMGHDGTLYDESRRNKQLQIPDKELVKKTLKKEDWNEYLIRAEGPRIQMWLNGVQTVDFTEKDEKIPRKGIIAMQMHGGCKAIVRYKDIEIRELPLVSSLKRFGEGYALQEPHAPFRNRKFTLEKNDTVVFTGQTDIVRSRHDGTLEAALAAQFADAKPRFRNMAWEGDTVYEQWRDLNFGTWEDQLAFVNASVVFAQFGQMEALDGAGRTESFIAAYEKLLDQFASRTKRLVLISPRRFETSSTYSPPDLLEKNAAVEQYVEAIRALAERRGAVFVDLFAPFADNRKPLTTNGVHLTAEGQTRVAREIAKQLGVKTRGAKQNDSLALAICDKNRLWFDNWRPMNWTFAYGDRTQQPFGQPVEEHPALRVELEKFRPLMEQADARVHAIAANSEAPSIEYGASLSAPNRVEGSAPKDVKTGDNKKVETEAPDDSPEAELASFKMADGFEVNLFASEADGVVKPLQMRWDDRGRLWVICAPTYPQIQPGAKPNDYVLVCEDTNADGRADKFTRFAEGLFMPMGIEFGAGGVYLAEWTELVHLKDTNDDGKADKRTIVLSGFGAGDAHQMINGLAWGPGGELWFGQGHHIYSHVETPWGIEKLEKSGLWRFRPRTGRLAPFFNLSTGGLNCQGLDYDRFGQIFHNSAAYSGGFYTVPGMIRTARPLPYWAMATPERRNTGIEVLGSSHLPHELQGCLLWSGYISNDVQLHKVIDEGSGFRAEALPNLMSSSRREFRPVNTRVGPDGAIYICDWYNQIIGHYQASYRDPRRDKSHGRIWRVTAKGQPLVKQPDIARMSPAELLEQLKSPEKLTRYNAKRRLLDSPTADVIAAADAFVAGLTANDSDAERLLLEVIGVYEAHEVVRPGVLLKLLAAKDHRARAYGARVVGNWAERLPNALSLLEKLVTDEAPRVRLEAIVACSYVRDMRAIEVAARAVDLPRDPFIDYALSQATDALKPLWYEPLRRGELRFDDNAERLRFVLEADGSRDIAGVVRNLSKNKDLPSEARESLLVLLANVGGADDLRYAFLQGRESAAVLNALAAAAEVHGRKPKGELGESIEALLSNDGNAIQGAVIRLIGAWKLERLAPQIEVLLENSTTSESIVLAALPALARLKEKESLPMLARYTGEECSLPTRVAAFDAIANLDLPDAASRAVSAMIQTPREEVIVGLFPTVLNHLGGDAALAEALVQVEIKPDTAKLALRVLAALGRGDASLIEPLTKAAGVETLPAEFDAKLVKELVSSAAEQGDAKRGREVFLSKVGACSTCHKLGPVGGDIGPDLTQIGVGRAPDALIESLLWPNRQVREGYMSTKVLTDDGRVLTGYKLKETNDEIELRDTSNNQIRRIAKSSIEEMADGGSVMPQGLTAAMTRGEVLDLIRFLCDAGKP